LLPGILLRRRPSRARLLTAPSFSFAGPPANAALTDYRLTIADTPDFASPALQLSGITRPRVDLDDAAKKLLVPGRWYYWRVSARGPHGETTGGDPCARFLFDPARPSTPDEPEVEIGPDGLIVRAALRGDPKPDFGLLKSVTGFAKADGPDGAADGAIRLDGRGQMLVYALPEELPGDYSVSVWFRLAAFPEKRIGQVFSAWAAGMDDPLRLTIDGGKLFARIEAQRAFSTKGAPVTLGQWRHLAAVKAGTNLTLYLDGRAQDTVSVPQFLNTMARSCALGDNLNFSGNEFLAADFARFEFHARARSPEEVDRLAAKMDGP
jgi:hypothetical protein